MVPAAALHSPHHHAVTLQQLGRAGEQLVWDAFHAALRPIVRAARMGCVVFQFQLSFLDTGSNRAHVEHCREMLDPDLAMAVEFRNRSWFTGAALVEGASRGSQTKGQLVHVWHLRGFG